MKRVMLALVACFVAVAGSFTDARADDPICGWNMLPDGRYLAICVDDQANDFCKACPTLNIKDKRCVPVPCK